MKKLLLTFTIIISIFLVAGVLVAAIPASEGITNIVKDVVKEKGISEEFIQEVKEVDFADLPEGVNIENIDDNNLALYQVDVGEEKPFFVITVSDTTFKKIEKEAANKMFINFGLNRDTKGPVFLETSTGVQTSEEKGYVMMRAGSITGLSTNLEVLEGKGEIEITIYKNNKEFGFRNLILVENTGAKKDYDLQSEGIVTFEAGDTIAVYLKTIGDITLTDITTLIELSI